MKQTTQQVRKKIKAQFGDKLESFLTSVSEKWIQLHKKTWPDKEVIKVFTHRRWGNRYGRGYRFSQLITHEGLPISHWMDITLLRREDLIQANQTMLKLGYEFKHIKHW